MNYPGSKRLLAKHLAPIIQSYRQLGQLYIEPFMGGGNMLMRFANPRIGADIDRYVVALLRAVRDGWTPPTEVTRDLYYAVKAHPDQYPDELVGFVGYPCSFGGKWWGGYVASHLNQGRNRASGASNTLRRESQFLQGAEIRQVTYDMLPIPDGSLVYCDPPYRDVTQGYRAKGFDSDRFWHWVRNLPPSCTVLVSEYTAPTDGFELLYAKKVTANLQPNRVGKVEREECLFLRV